MGTESGTFCHLLLHWLGQFMELEIRVPGGFFGNLHFLDHPPPRIGAKAPGMPLGVLDRRWEERVKLVLSGLGIKRQYNALIAVEPIGPLDQLQRVESRRAVGHLAEIHRAVAGHEVLGVDKAESMSKALMSLLISSSILGRQDSSSGVAGANTE